MRRRLSRLLAPAVIALAAGLCLLAAIFATDEVERRTSAAVAAALEDSALGWATARADGMKVHLTGNAPDEAARFHALSAASAVMDAANVIDDMKVAAAREIAAPTFRVELLSNDMGISAIGLVPATTDREALARDLSRLAEGKQVADMLGSAGRAAPAGWDDALSFGLRALRDLDRAKVSITPGKVTIAAVTDSREARQKIERSLRKAAPDGVSLTLDIAAPRPVITPFTLRFRLDKTGARFDACAADNAEDAAHILAAARAAGMAGQGRCTVALGAPDPGWAEAAAQGIAALAELGGGTLTFSDADVTLVAQPGTEAALFDRVAGDLEAALPDIFTLYKVLPDPVSVDGSGDEAGPKEFIATLSPEGLLQLRGRVPDTLVRTAVESYARSRFGGEHVHSVLRVDDDLPEGWPLRALSGLEALSQLRNGALIVQADYLRLTGLTQDDTAKARIAQILSDRLGEAQNYAMDITYREPERAETGGLPTPAECVAEIEEILARTKITFAPGSTEIEGAAIRVVDRIANVLRTCPDAKIEIGGHTDSQGRETMNQELSQARAEAVLNGLIARRVLTGNLTAKGYGEEQPIAPNDSEEGREANRRIEFRLIGAPGPEAEADAEDAPETQAEDASDGQD